MTTRHNESWFVFSAYPLSFSASKPGEKLENIRSFNFSHFDNVIIFTVFLYKLDDNFYL